MDPAADRGALRTPRARARPAGIRGRAPGGSMSSPAAAPALYLLGRQTVGRAAAVLGAAILAVGPFAVFYGVEARPYATMAFFVVVSTLALLRAVATGTWWWWLAYALAAAAAAYSH